VKERLLWFGWSLVVVAWLALPFLSGQAPWLPGSSLIAWLVHPLTTVLGSLMMAAGYGGTLWCYVAMGNDWRMGINRTENTHLVTRGPYHLVRHPIYGFQWVMVVGIVLLLPSVLSFLVLVIHLVCIWTKADDEEAYLRTLLGRGYENYFARTGRWLPRLFKRNPPPPSLSAGGGRPLKPVEPPVK
jgi:protein-S-isoprenylcysteine O-methyltransferase Ste14